VYNNQQTVTDGALRNKRDLPEFKTEVMDAQRMSYKDNSFDTIIDTFGLCSFEVTEHDPPRLTNPSVMI
jgi:hypothetical protein